jgi:hypothetical protein
MLAEFGDPVGLALAVHVANADGFDRLRFAAVEVLGAVSCLGKTHPEEAQRAVALLEGLTSKSGEPHLLSDILRATQRDGFPSGDRDRIQSILDQSGRLPEYVQAARKSYRNAMEARARIGVPEWASSQPVQRVWRPRGVRLDPPELEMPISHRESRTFHVALAGGPENCVVKEVLSDEPNIQASPRAEADRKGYTIDITVKETTPQNRTNYIVVQLEGCERPFLVLPVKFFRQVATRPAVGPASRPASRAE